MTPSIEDAIKAVEKHRDDLRERATWGMYRGAGLGQIAEGCDAAIKVMRQMAAQALEESKGRVEFGMADYLAKCETSPYGDPSARRI